MQIESDVKNDTRKRILDIAEELLLTRGFNGFSYQQISRELGVRNAAIHYHFPHKTDLGLALIERYRRRLQRLIDAQTGLPPREQLEQYFALAQRYFAQDRQLCPSGMLSSEFQTLPAAMQQAAQRFIEAMHAWSVTLVRSGQQAQVFHFAGEAEDMGALIFAALQGGLQLARIDEAWLVRLKRQICLLLGLSPAIN